MITSLTDPNIRDVLLDGRIWGIFSHVWILAYFCVPLKFRNFYNRIQKYFKSVHSARNLRELSCQICHLQWKRDEWDVVIIIFFRSSELDYMTFRLWIGVWSCFFCMIIVALDLSAVVRYFTRFTEESFAALIGIIFIVESLKKLFSKYKKCALCLIRLN